MDFFVCIVILAILMPVFIFLFMLTIHKEIMEGAGKTPGEERKDKVEQMNEFDQLISELDTPLDIVGEPLDLASAEEKRDKVIKKLVKIGDTRAVEPLIKTAEKSDFYEGFDLLSNTRYSAIKALGKLGDERAVETLVKALSDKDKDIRDSAIKALGKLGGKKAVEALVKALSDKDKDIRGSAARALDKLGWNPEDS